jgi:hypothetical protein
MMRGTIQPQNNGGDGAAIGVIYSLSSAVLAVMFGSSPVVKAVTPVIESPGTTCHFPVQQREVVSC